MRRFRGEQHGQVYETGNRLKVAIDAVDLKRKFVDFRVVRSR